MAFKKEITPSRPALSLALASSLTALFLGSPALAAPVSLKCITDGSGEVQRMTMDPDQNVVTHNFDFDAPLTQFTTGRQITIPLNVGRNEVSYMYQIEPGGVGQVNTYKINMDSLKMIHTQSFNIGGQVSVNTHQGQCQMI